MESENHTSTHAGRNAEPASAGEHPGTTAAPRAPWPVLGFFQRSVGLWRAVGGIVLWSFLLLLPCTHLGLVSRMPLLHLALLFGPLVVLSVSILTGSRTGCVALFPCSLVPLLILVPELAGPRIYGIGAFLALAGATVSYLFVVQVPPASPVSAGRAPAPGAGGTERAARVLLIHTVVAGSMLGVLVYWLNFHRPTLRLLQRAHAGYSPRALVFVGLVVFAVWTAFVVRLLVGRLGTAMSDRDKLMAEWYRFEGEALAEGRLRTSLFWALVVGAVSAGGLLLVLAAAR